MYAKHKFNADSKQNIIFRKELTNRDLEIIYKMCKCWYDDYLDAGDYASSYASKSELNSLAKAGHLVVAIVGGKYAGFGELKICDGVKVINVVYVAPYFRNRGVAKALYQYLINQCRATEIELTFRRVLDRLDYWKSIGFESLMSLGQSYGARDLCRLSTSGAETRLFAVPLTRADIQHYREQRGFVLMANRNPLDFFKFTNF